MKRAGKISEDRKEVVSELAEHRDEGQANFHHRNQRSQRN